MACRFSGIVASSATAASLAVAIAMASPAFAGTVPVISEIRTGQPGPDTQEYIELRGTPGSSLNGLSYVVISDDDTQLPPAQNGYIEYVLNLTGLTFPASGYLVIAKGTFTLGVANVITTLNFEDNSNATHLLVQGFTGGVGTDIDANNDGIADLTPWTSVVSGVALVSNSDPDGVTGNFVYSTELVGPDGTNVPSHVYRCQNSDEYRVAAVDPTVGDDTVGADNPTCSSSGSPLRISEIRIDQGGTDNDEYFELEGPAGTSLNDYSYVVIGDGAGGSGTVEAIVALAGLTIPADGFFLVAEPTLTLGGATPDFVTAANGLNFENTDNVTHLLVKGFTGSTGADLDTNDDGVLDVTPWTEIADSVAVIIDGAVPPTTSEFVYSTTIVGPDGAFAPGHVYRCSPYGDWKVGVFDPSVGLDTPGAENFNCPSCGGSGSCFVVHATPGCDLIDCCSVVCVVDPSCCTTDWDATCVSAATTNCTARGPVPSLAINELRIGQAGADNDEYVEILGTPGASLNGVSYVVLGDGASGNGYVESVTLLSGTIPGDGYLVVAKGSFTLGAPDLVRSSINFEDSDSVTHLIVKNFTGTIGQNLDPNNDCTLDVTPWTDVIDSLGLIAPGTDCVYATTTVGPDGSFSPAHSYKCSTAGTWTVGLFDSLVNDTPGAANAACPPPNPCGVASNDCYTVSATPGCADADCCNAICVVDPTCCSAGWDADCVSAAQLNCFVPPNPPAVRLSEIRTDQTGDDNDEYFELVGSANQSLNGLTYVVIGDGSQPQGSGVIEMAVSLNASSIPADGFFLAAKDTFTLGGATPDKTVATGFFFENGDNVTHMLVWQFTGAVGDDLDTNDDGTLDVTPWDSVVDSVALLENADVPPTGTEYVYSTTLVGPDGTFVPSHAKFCPSTSTWTIGTFDVTTSDDSPGTANPDCVYTPPCIADLSGDGTVGGADLAILLGQWGSDGSADLNDDGIVGGADLAILLGAWGPCPR